jgi:hypothetical protein
VESQQDDARRAEARHPELSPEARDQVRRRTTLELALANTEAELQVACRPAHREMLRQKVAALKTALGTP